MEYYDIPKVCDQALIIASNDFDVFTRNLTMHDTEQNLYITPLDPEGSRFNMIHDYKNNSKSSHHQLCKNTDATEEIAEQEVSPGIFMAIEVENIKLDISSQVLLEKAIAGALVKEGLHVDHVIPRGDNAETIESGPVVEFSMILREGYLFVRSYPRSNYCLLDFHLFGSFDKHESAKVAVVEAIGGSRKTMSSFRIVAGGMFGVDTWKEDAKNNGPQFDKPCAEEQHSEEKHKSSRETHGKVLDIALDLAKGQEFSAIVLCERRGDCEASKLLSQNQHDVANSIELALCEDIQESDVLSLEGRERIRKCESELLETILSSYSKTKKLNLLVVDNNVSSILGQIVLKLLEVRRDLLDDNVAVIGTVPGYRQTWLWSFLNAFRQDIIVMDPVHELHAVLKTRDGTLDFGVLAGGDTQFFDRLEETISQVNRESGSNLDILSVNGGLWRVTRKLVMEDEEADIFFAPMDYNQTSPLEQWNSQTPVAHQSLFQLELRTLQEGDAVSANYEDEGEMHPGRIDGVDEESDLYDVAYDDGDYEKGVHRSQIRKVDGSDNALILSESKIREALEYTLAEFSENQIVSPQVHHIDDTAGAGSVHVAFWSSGSALVMWDGRGHVDINLVSFLESISFHAEFADLFRYAIPDLETILRDEQPRGYGRVVNFARDLGVGHREPPKWVY